MQKLNKTRIQEFDNLVLEHADGLRPFAITLTRDLETANDLCQETLYKAFSYRSHYQPGTNIKAWLYTIMRNIFINEYRRRARKKIVFDTLKYFKTQSVMASEKVLLKEIHLAVNRLPEIFKQACILYLQGYKYAEIAKTLDQPLGTIKSRIHFARKILQKQISR